LALDGPSTGIKAHLDASQAASMEGSSTMLVTGWAFSLGSGARTTVYLDRESVAECTVRQPRPDAGSLYPEHELVELRHSLGPYEAGQQWADPDPGGAAHWMLRLAADADLRSRLGNAAKRDIRRSNSAVSISLVIRQRLLDAPARAIA
jgi:hypothetical protein